MSECNNNRNVIVNYYGSGNVYVGQRDECSTETKDNHIETTLKSSKAALKTFAKKASALDKFTAMPCTIPVDVNSND